MTINIQRGQIWADNYYGNKGRTIRVDKVGTQYVYATVVTNPHDAQKALDAGRYGCNDVRGRTTRILRTAFRPGPARTGYSLTQEAE